MPPTRAPASPAGASFLVDRTVAAEGYHSLRLTTPTAGEGVSLAFCTAAPLAPPKAGNATLEISLMLRHSGTRSLTFGLQPMPDQDAGRCCTPGAPLASRGGTAGAPLGFHTLTKRVPIPPSCDVRWCQLGFAMGSAGTAWLDGVTMSWV